MVSARRLSTYVGTALTVVVLSIGLFGATAQAKDGGENHGGQKIRILDDCDPKTFNAVLGPGACVGKGDTTVTEFLAELKATKQVEDWRFEPDEKEVKAGRPVVAQNRGGETHTFTCVTKFGGGFVELLNQLSGNTTIATLCAGGPAAVRDPKGKLVPSQNFLATNSFVAPRGTARSELVVNLSDKGIQQSPKNSGRYLFQCLIHPWMRTVLTVDRDDRD